MSKGQFSARLRLFVSTLIFCIAIPFAAQAQNQQGITLKMTDVTLEEVFDAVEQQSRYLFLNDRVELDRKVNIDVDGKSVEAVLDHIFSGTDITYSIQGTNIYISVKSTERDDSRQGNKVSGTVIDATGWPVIGAAVLIKGTTTGSSTDIDGRFEFDLPTGAGGGRIGVLLLGL